MPKSKKIFIVEDDANLLYGLQAKFSLQGFEVITDEGLDKTDILDKILTGRPDFIILDIILPKLNGLELLKEIKANQAIHKIPVFIFTNLSDNDSRQQAAKFGAEIYFLKADFILDDFVDKFVKIISNKEKLADLEKINS